MAVTALSLFSGIGGLDLAAEAAGFAPVAFVEREPFCRAVLAHHWPEVPIHDDVAAFPVRRYAGVALVYGGFPCQDISCAGRGAGLAGERSGLWFVMLDIIAALRPRFVVAENVSALRNRGVDRVLCGLEEAGYAANALVVAAEDMGAPHRRERVFIVAELADAPGKQDRGAFLRGIPPDAVSVGVGQADTDAMRKLQQEGSVANVGGRVGDSGSGRRGLRTAQSRVGRATDGVPGGVDRCAVLPAWPARPGEAQHDWEAPRTKRRQGRGRNGSGNRNAQLKALGNAVVPAQAYPVFAALARRYREVTQ